MSMVVVVALSITLVILIVFAAGRPNDSVTAKVSRNFCLNISDVGYRVGSEIYYGKSPFRLSRMGSEYLWVMHFKINDNSEKEAVCFPDNMRRYFLEYIEELEKKRGVTDEFFMKIRPNSFIWVRGQYCMVIFSDDDAPKDAAEAVSIAESIKSLLDGKI